MTTTDDIRYTHTHTQREKVATFSIRSAWPPEKMVSKRSNGSSLQIPVIDLFEASEAITADQLVDAVARYGFVFIKGEGTDFTKQIVDDTFELVRPKRSHDRTDNSNDVENSQKDFSPRLQKRKKNVLSKPT